MAEMRECSVEYGRVFAANNGRRVRIGGREAILLHNNWVDLATGEHHQVGLDFRSDPSVANGEVTAECARFVREVFSDLIEGQEWRITEEYVQSLPEIYQDIFRAFPVLEPHRGFGDGLAIQTLYAALSDKYELGQIREACEQLADGGAMVLRLRMFACPTGMGEEIIARLTGKTTREAQGIPPFSPPPMISSR
jgi:hypothetical protein